MRKLRTITGSCIAVAAVVSAFGTPTNASAGTHLWVEAGKIVGQNKTILASIVTGTLFFVRANVLNNNVVIKCGHVAYKNAIIFNGLNHGGIPAAQGNGELELSTCATNVCNSVSEPIKLPISGNGETTVADDSVSSAKHLYDDFLPDSSKRFAEFTLSGGSPCTTAKQFVISNTLTRGGLGAIKEGEGGILAEIDAGKAEAEEERTSHTLTFACNVREQLPMEAFNQDESLGVGEKIIVGLEAAGGNAACLEGKITLDLENGAHFSVIF